MDLAAVNVRSAWATFLAVSALAIGLLVWIIYLKEPAANGAESLTFLPLLNCILNGSSAVCLVSGVFAIRRGRARVHMRWMIAAFSCSAAFLVGYILHHHLHGDTRFPPDNSLRAVYLFVLASHILLSVVCLPMIFMTFFFSLSGRLAAHKRLARFTFPIWLYVSVTGVLVFVMLKTAGA